MDFSFSQDIAELEQGARTFLESANGVERLRLDGNDPLSLWAQLTELGLLGVTAPESAGGLGIEFSEAVRICQTFGYSNLPEPAGEIIAVTVPVLAKHSRASLRELVAGASRVVVSHGLNPCVNLLEGSDQVLVITQKRVSLHATAGVTSSAVSSVDPWRHLRSIDDLGDPVDVIADSDEADQLWQDSANRGAVEASAEMCGLAERMILLATEYAKGRQQFGQAIGRFQAVKHMLASAQVKLEFACPVVYRAAADIDSPRSELFAAHAKVAATEASMLAGETAIQVFGGMGYTYEADLHYFMKRVWALAGIWGSKEYHLGIIEQAVNRPDFNIGPAATFATG